MSTQGKRALALLDMWDENLALKNEVAVLRGKLVTAQQDEKDTDDVCTQLVEERDAARAKILALQDAIAKMDAIHTSIMENGPRCTCGDGDEWCKRCGKSIKLSDIASRALEEDVQ